MNAWRDLHGDDVRFELVADESLVRVLGSDARRFLELKRAGGIRTASVSDDEILRLASQGDLHVITRDHYIDHRSTHRWIDRSPDQFHAWDTVDGQVRIVPLGIKRRSAQDISMAREVKLLRYSARLDVRNPAHQLILQTRWTCPNSSCRQANNWQGQLITWPRVSPENQAICPSCNRPLVAIGARAHMWEVVVEDRTSQEELTRFPLEADVPVIVGRGAAVKGIDLAAHVGPSAAIEVVSRLHLLLRIDEASPTNWRLAVIDLNSTNGTVVERWSGNGFEAPRPVSADKETYLSSRDQLILGDSVQLRLSGRRYIGDTELAVAANVTSLAIRESGRAREATDPKRLGPYRVVRRLGAGGMGTVYLGEPRVGRRVAIKVLRPEMAEAGDASARFEKEVEAARRVSSPNVVSIIDSDMTASVPWLAMEYVQGPSLSRAVGDQFPLPAPAMLALAAGLAQALSAAHRAGIVHQDVKPSNVLLSADKPMLADFGIASAVIESAEVSGLIAGTPAFMSPEQVAGGPVGPPSDIFSLGATLTFAATGDPPFGWVDTPSALSEALQNNSPRLHGVPADMASLITRCMAIDPADRPTAEEISRLVGQLVTPQSDEVYRRFVGTVAKPGVEPEGALATDENWPLPRYASVNSGHDGPEARSYDPPGGSAVVTTGTGRGPEPSGGDAPGVSAVHEPARYLKGECPDAVRVGEPFSVLVSVVLQSSAEVKPLKPFHVSRGGNDILIVLHAPGLRVLSRHREVLHVPSRGNSEPVMFELEPYEPGPCQLTFTAWRGGTFLGQLAVETTATLRHQQVGEHRDFFAEVQNGAVEGAVALVVRYDKAQNSYRFEFRDEDNPAEVASNLVYQPAPLVEQLIAGLDRLARGRSGYSAAETRNYLVNAGAGLWADLLPAQLREQFWERQGRIRQLTILSDSDAIPWELLYPLDPGHDAGFLVEQFPVTRAVFGRRPSQSLNLFPARFVLPDKSPRQAHDEVAALRQVMAQQLADPVIISELTPLLDLIQGGNFGLLHFACHNSFDTQNGSAISLDERLFTPTQLNTAAIGRALERSAPTVFINACRSAGMSPCYYRLDGWASKFLNAGAAAFIGSQWAVRDSTARDFACELYQNLQNGRPLGQAVMAARESAASEPGDPTWLSYSVYGDPRATIQ